jgi:hypothetical protein
MLVAEAVTRVEKSSHVVYRHVKPLVRVLYACLPVALRRQQTPGVIPTRGTQAAHHIIRTRSLA